MHIRTMAEAMYRLGGHAGTMAQSSEVSAKSRAKLHQAVMLMAIAEAIALEVMEENPNLDSDDVGEPASGQPERS